MAIELQKPIRLTTLHSLHYFEFTKNYKFEGEAHPFRELQYVDKGSFTVFSDGIPHELNAGQAIFHAPNEFHSSVADGRTNPNLLVLSYDCTGIESLDGKILSLTDGEREHLASILALAKACFPTRLDLEREHNLTPSPDADPRKQEEILLRLELLLLLLTLPRPVQTPSLAVNRTTVELVKRYLERTAASPFDADAIERKFHLGYGYLNRLFKARYDVTIKEAFLDGKIRLAKDALRGGNWTVKQIAERLGYASSAFFCRQFREKTGMTPLEYKKSVM